MPSLNTTLPPLPEHDSSPSASQNPGGWVGEKFSLARSTEEPQASAGELQLSW